MICGDTMDWKARRTWGPIISAALASLVGPNYRRLLQKARTTIVFSDDPDKGFEALKGLAKRTVICRAVRNKWRADTRYIVAYHGCRTDDVKTYYERGLQPLELELAREVFRRRFAAPPFSVPPSDLEAAIAALPTETTSGVTHLALDDRILIKLAGHYLIYGSEYINALAVHVNGRGMALRDSLRDKGRATILKCRLSLNTVRNQSRLVDRMLADHFFRVAHGGGNLSHLDHTVTIRGALPPGSVLSHRHPVRMRDPYSWRIWNDRKRQLEGRPVP